jgi:L-threonylcarbamoyladenylate synthase
VTAGLAAQIAEGVTRLRAGRLVAFPTETVYGLGADARNTAALAAVFAAKGRPADHPLIVHLADDADPAAWTTDLPPLAVRLIARFWPGPLTLIVKRAPSVPAALAGGQDTVGLRCPDHAVAQALLRGFNASAPADATRGIAAPSANRFGRISPTRAAHVASEFIGQDVYIIDGGACPIGIESTILDVSRLDRQGPVLLRPGSISAEDLAEAIGDLPQQPDATAPRVAGALAAHYAPRTPLRLVDAASLAALPDTSEVAVWSYSLAPRSARWMHAPADASRYARDLYDVLRQLDAMGTPCILIERPPVGASWAAVHDRLSRAATGSGA